MEKYRKFSGKKHRKFSEIFRKNMKFSGQFFRLTTLIVGEGLGQSPYIDPAHLRGG